jgi:hypothetical protein
MTEGWKVSTIHYIISLLEKTIDAEKMKSERRPKIEISSG